MADTKLGSLPVETTLALADFIVKVKAAGAGDVLVTLQNFLTFAITNISASSIAGQGVWWEELGRATLGTAGNTITISSLAAKTYLRIIVNVLNNGGATTPNVRFNNDSGANYAIRFSNNGGADATSVSQAVINSGTGVSGQRSQRILEITNVAANEKLVYVREVHASTAGGGTPPDRYEISGKWANTSAQITRVDVINGGAGNFGIGSEVIVLGHN